MAGRPRRGESFAERRERRAAIDDPAVVLEAAARFLEARSRSVAEVRRRLGGAGYRGDLIEAAKEFLKTSPEIAADIESRIRGKITDTPIPVEGIEEAE